MKILVGLDRSKVADDVIALALKHAKAFEADVTLMTSLEQGPELKKEEIDRVESRLERLKAPFMAAGIACTTQVSVGFNSPGEDLIRFITANDVDEIIIGVRRRSKVGKLVFGSTAQYIILKAPCAVVSIK